MNHTEQRIIKFKSKKQPMIKYKIVDLIITSPPYLMISMWDETFKTLNKKIMNN